MWTCSPNTFLLRAAETSQNSFPGLSVSRLLIHLIHFVVSLVLKLHFEDVKAPLVVSVPPPTLYRSLLAVHEPRGADLY